MSIDSSESELDVCSISEEDCIDLANSLITIIGADIPAVRSLSDIEATLWIRLYDEVFGVAVPEIVQHPTSYEEKWISVDAIINTISLDIIKTSLFHISPEDILAGNVCAVHDLLQIFHGYVVHCRPKSSDAVSSEKLPSSKKVDNGLKPHLEKTVPSDVISVCGMCGYPQGCKLQYEVSCPVCGRYRGVSTLPKVPISQENKILTDVQDLPDQLVEGTLPPFSQVCDESKSEAAAAFDQKDESDFFSPQQHGSLTIPKEIALPEDQLDKEMTPVLPDAVMLDTQTEPKTLWPTDIPQVPERSAMTRIICKKSKSLNEMYNLKWQPKDKETQTSVGAFAAEGQKHVVLKHKLKGRHPRPDTVTFFYPDQDKTEKLYKRNLEERVKTFLEDSVHYRRVSINMRKQYLQSLKKPKKKPISPICKKSFLLPYYLKYRTTHPQPKKRSVKVNSAMTSRHSSAEQSVEHNSRKDEATPPKDAEFLKEIKEAFPGIQLSPSSVRVMKQRYEKHLNYICKELEEVLHTKSRTQIQAEEALKRQKILNDILRKENLQNQQLSEKKEMKSLDQQIEALHRKQKMDTVKAKQYFNELHVNFNKKLQPAPVSHENQLAKNLFSERLNLEKQEFIELKKQLKEEQKKGAEHYKIYLEAMENFYQTQFAMLAESFAVEKQDNEMRTKAQKQAMASLKRDLNRQMEKEIHKMQSELIELQKDTYPRERQASQYLEKLRDQFSAHSRPYTQK